ncbi:hypothetical protein AVEN_178810-1 [Araneus ventricosus]|uniref:Uncharacterized protein n=1 Tax=Araneus ventricosus TaxID=182803 RepID=A0A4Y2BGV0_ARAVE|nr:hypothetical protein AVEN_178810-1 [Araneus ventricosus]
MAKWAFTIELNFDLAKLVILKPVISYTPPSTSLNTQTYEYCDGILAPPTLSIKTNIFVEKSTMDDFSIPSPSPQPPFLVEKNKNPHLEIPPSISCFLLSRQQFLV